MGEDARFVYAAKNTCDEHESVPPRGREGNVKMEIPNVTDESFESEVLRNELPVLVDFWGDHCAACRQISPILQELSQERSGALKIVKIHAAENAMTSARFGVRAMPTVLLFDGGEVSGQLVGARPKADFARLVDEAK